MDTLNSMTVTDSPSSWVASGNASVDAMINSNQIWAAGCKKIGDIMAETATGHFKQAATAWQAMGQVKTVKEAVELQSTYLRTTAEHSVAGAKKLVNATNELTREVMSAKIDRLPTLSPASVSIA